VAGTALAYKRCPGILPSVKFRGPYRGESTRMSTTHILILGSHFLIDVLLIMVLMPLLRIGACIFPTPYTSCRYTPVMLRYIVLSTRVAVTPHTGFGADAPTIAYGTMHHCTVVLAVAHIAFKLAPP
jgi:hypothetical protein